MPGVTFAIVRGLDEGGPLLVVVEVPGGWVAARGRDKAERCADFLEALDLVRQESAQA